MFLAFLFFLDTKSHNKFDGLIAKAYSNAKQAKLLRTQETEETTAFPGDYHLSDNHFHFTLHKVLTSPTTVDVKGYAMEQDYVAIVHSKRRQTSFEDETVFVVPETQKLYSLHSVYSEGKCHVYRTNNIELLDVISNIKIEVDVDASTYGNSAELMGGLYLNWDREKDKPVEFSIDKQGVLNYGFGGKLEASIKATFELPSLRSASLKFDLVISGEVGAFINLKSGELKLIEDLLIAKVKKQLYGYDKTFIGLHFQFDISLALNFGLRDTDIILEADLEYYKGYTMTASKQLIISFDGISETDWKLELGSKQHSPSVNEVVETLSKAVLEFVPYAQIAIEFNVCLTYIINIGLSVGVDFSFPMSFNLDFEQCAFPFLYGSVYPKISAILTFPGLELFTFKLIPQIQKQWQLFKGSPYDFCLINPTKTMEGDKSLINNDVNSWGLIDFVSTSDESGDTNLKQVYYGLRATQSDGKVLGGINSQFYSTYQPTRTNIGMTIVRQSNTSFNIRYVSNYFNWANDLVQSLNSKDFEILYDTDYLEMNDSITYRATSKITRVSSIYERIYPKPIGQLFSRESSKQMEHPFNVIIEYENNLSSTLSLIKYDYETKKFTSDIQGVKYSDITNYNKQYDNRIDNDFVQCAITLDKIIPGGWILPREFYRIEFSLMEEDGEMRPLDHLLLTATLNGVFNMITSTGPLPFSEFGYDSNYKIYFPIRKGQSAKLHVTFSTRNNADITVAPDVIVESFDIPSNISSTSYSLKFNTIKFADELFFNVEATDDYKSSTIISIPQSGNYKDKFMLVREFSSTVGNVVSIPKETLAHEYIKVNLEGISNTSFNLLIETSNFVPMQEYSTLSNNMYIISFAAEDPHYIIFRKAKQEVSSEFINIIDFIDLTGDSPFVDPSVKLLNKGFDESKLIQTYTTKDSWKVASNVNDSINIKVKSIGPYYLITPLDLGKYPNIESYSLYNSIFVMPNDLYVKHPFESWFNHDWVGESAHVNVINNFSFDSIKVVYQNESVNYYEIAPDNSQFISKEEAIQINEIYRVCNNETSTMCLIHKQLDPDTLYHVQYPSSSGVKETSNILGSGFTQEVIYGISNVEYYKTWNKSVKFEQFTLSGTHNSKKVLSDDNTLIFVREKVSENSTRVKAYFKCAAYNPLPFSRKLIENDLPTLMKAIGITEYNSSEVIFTELGEVTFPIDMMIDPDKTLFASAANIPASYINNIDIEDHATNNQEDSSSQNIETNKGLGTVTIAGIVIAVVIVIVAGVGLGMFIYLKRKPSEGDYVNSEVIKHLI